METLREKFAPVTDLLATATPLEYAIIIAAVLVLWFLPTIVALFRNRKYLKLIFTLNIPLGLTITPWVILLAFAATKDSSVDALLAKLGRRRKQDA